MKISFGMIFSIILIVIFIAVAFYGISKFLDYQKRIQIGQFVNYFQEDVKKMNSPGSISQDYSLPNAIEYICFADVLKKSSGDYAEFYNEFKLSSSGGDKNMFFYPKKAAEGYNSIKLENINLENITNIENPYCIKNEKGQVKINIKMNLGENLVTITKA